MINYNELVPLPKITLNFIFTQNICRFCVGDRFYLCDNKILCENDYADRQMYAQQTQQNQQNFIENNNSEYSINRNTNKSQASVSTNNIMPVYSDKSNFTNFDVPIHVR